MPRPSSTARPIKIDQDRIVGAYLDAKMWALEHGGEAELEWQESALTRRVDETSFLREFGWVVLSAGMAERVVRARFAAVSQAFLGWRSATMIVRRQSRCRAVALDAFAHARKIDAVIRAAERVAATGFEHVRAALENEGTDFLETFDYIGPVTKYHLAKNLGCDVVKPDRHLLRIAAAVGTDSPQHLCKIISDFTGDRVAVVDLVLWRYAVEHPDYLAMFDTPNCVH